MKKIYLLITVALLIQIPFSLHSQTLTYQVNNTFTTNTEIFPFNQNDYSYGLSIIGSIHLNSDSSMARVVLTDNNMNEYLVFEGIKLICPSGDSILTNASEETCLLNNVALHSIKIELIDASVHLSSIANNNTYIDNVDTLRKNLLQAKLISKINHINQQLTIRNKAWRAGTTSIAQLTYAQKKNLFANNSTLGNLQGLEYYISGFYSSINDISSTNSSINGYKAFDWRNRHGANNSLMTNGNPNPYYDGDISGSGWIPPRFTEQDGAVDGTCWAMAPTYSLQSIVNLYYNRHLDLDLSEQDMVSCSGGMQHSCLEGGYPDIVLSFMGTNGIVDEYCFPYRHCDEKPYPDCSDTCDAPQERIKISSYESSNFSNTKESIIKYGPLTSEWPGIPHAMSLIGYGIVEVGKIIYYSPDNPIFVTENCVDIGKTYWIFEQSIGLYNSDNINNIGTPFIYIINDGVEYGFSNYRIKTPLSSLNYNSSDISCVDHDGDGYYNWGIGEKPKHCTNCPDEEDCNDADPTVGPYDGFYNCKSICTYAPYSNIPIEITSNEIWTDNLCLNRDVIVKTGKTLIIKSSVGFVSEAKIIVEAGAKLIVDGGILSGGCDNCQWQGIKVLGDYYQPQYEQYQGCVELKNSACIADALIGIETVHQLLDPPEGGGTPENPIIGGGIIKANNANFLNNNIAISMQPYKNKLPNSQIENGNVSIIEFCRFLIDKLNPNIVRPLFIRLQGVKDVNINYNYFNDKTPLPLATHCNGIEAYDASFHCFNSRGVGVDMFKNLYYGIKALYTNPILAPVIDFATFNNCYRSIYLSGNTSATITRNIFKIPSDNNNCYGLYLDNCTSYKVEGNEFYKTTTITQGDIGLIVNNSHEQLNYIYRNLFCNLNIALLAQNDNRGFVNTTGLKIKCNNFELNAQDIAVTYDPVCTYPGISNFQGFNDRPTAPAANVFSFCESSYPYEDYDNAGQQFTYFYNLPYPLYPLNLVPRKNHFTDNTILLWNTGIEYGEESCRSTIGVGDLVSLYTNMNNAQTEVKTTETQLKQLVDGGNTTALNTQVELSQPPQALQLRNTLLNKSPYLSDSVMITTISKEEVLTPLMLKQVLVANPQSSKSEILMDTLLNRNNPLPDYMIAEIEAGRNILSAKENLEAKIAYYYQEKELNFNEIVRRYKNDSLHTWANDSLAALLGRTNTTWAKYYLSFDQLYNSAPIAANEMLSSIPANFNLNTYEQNNYNDYYDYMQVLIALQQDSSSIYNMNNGQKQVLQHIAIKGNNYANAYARNLLIIADSLPYNEPIILPQLMGKSMHKQNKQLITDNKDAMLKIFPNPAKDYFTIEYKLNETANNTVIELADLTGKKLRILTLYDKQNQVIIETTDLQTGIYYIRLLINGATNKIQKISVIK